MRKVRHLISSDFILPLKQRSGGVITASCESVIALEKVWSHVASDEIEMELHASFESNNFDGLSLIARLVKNGKYLSSVNGSFSIYLVDISNWSESLIITSNSTEAAGVHSLNIPYSIILPNELSGAEVFSIFFICQRGRRFFRKKIYVNHLGIYESVIMLRRAIEANAILKADE